MKTARLMITGDDFGSSHAVNEAVEAHYRAGWLNQASLMMHGAECEEALRIAQRNPGLVVGLHLTLCVGSRKGQTRLTDAMGNFEGSPSRAGWRYFWKRDLRGAIREEIEEQFGRFVETGLRPKYWDGHTHLHMHSVVMRESLPVAVRLGFRRVRLVRTTGCGGLGWIFNRLSDAARPGLDAAGIGYAERIFGLKETGRMDEVRYREVLGAAEKFDVAEVYYHPGVDGPEELGSAGVPPAFFGVSPKRSKT